MLVRGYINLSFKKVIVALKETHFFLLSSFFDFHEISICSKQSWGISSSILPFQWCFLLAIWIQYNFMHSIWFVLTYYSSFYWWVFFCFFIGITNLNCLWIVLLKGQKHGLLIWCLLLIQVLWVLHASPR